MKQQRSHSALPAPRASGASGATAAMAHIQQEWWSEARRVSQVAEAKPYQQQQQQQQEHKQSRSAASSPVLEEVLQAVAHRASIARGATASSSPMRLPPPPAPTEVRQQQCSDSSGPVAAPQPAHHPRRSMVSSASPPPAQPSAYVKDRQVGSFAEASSSQKEHLVSYLQARSSTVGRVLGSPLPTLPQRPAAAAQEPWQQQEQRHSGTGTRDVVERCRAPGSAAWGGAQPPQTRTQGVFVWEDEPPLEAALGLHGGEAEAASQQPMPFPAVARPTSPFATASSQHSKPRPSLAASAAAAFAANGSPKRSPREPQQSFVLPQPGSRGQSPLGSARAAIPAAGGAVRAGIEARRASTVAFLEGGQSLVDQISCEMPVYNGDGYRGDADQFGALRGGPAATRHSAVAQAIGNRIAGAGELVDRYGMQAGLSTSMQMPQLNAWIFIACLNHH